MLKELFTKFTFSKRTFSKRTFSKHTFSKHNVFKESLFINMLSLYTLLPIVLFFILLPHITSISISIILYIIAILFWFTLHTLGIIPLPGKWIRFVLVLFSIILLVMNYGFIFSQKASLSFLSIMLCLKLFEIKNDLDRRNIFVILFLSYFILVTYFIHSQDILLTLYVLTNIVILTLMLSSFNRRPMTSLSLTDNFYLIGRLFVKAIPIAIILFLFFPRIPGPLWSLPENGQSGTTGLSDKMYPGSVTNLADSNEVAFRVDFKDSTLPPAEKLYWRGPVLSQTDGFLWSQKKQRPLKSFLKGRDFQDIVRQAENPVSYAITLEPHQQKWLFALEIPTNIKGDTIQGFYLSSDFQLLNKNNIYQITQYQVTSKINFKLNTVTKSELKDALVFPKSSNPKTYKLGKKWQKSFSSQQKIISQGLNYFRNNPFYYTKKPSSMINNPSDQFLFDEQRGFCEHYASSFVLLMRAAGIPARVVTGYQGLEKNDVGDYYVVRQSNAHAWAEVWLEDSRLNNGSWIRIDPTSMIPPDRIEKDIFETNLERLNFSSLNLPDLPKLSAEQKTAIYNFNQQLKQSIDNLKHRWNNWILGYDQTKQNLLLKIMGFTTGWQTLVFLLVGSLAGLIIIFQLFHFFQKYQQSDKVYKNYVKFINKLNQAGMLIDLSDGPDEVKNKAMNHFPDQKNIIMNIVTDYINIRYASKTNPFLIQQFISQVKQFKPR